MNLPRSSYYYRPKACGKDDEALIARIEAICAEFPRYGYRRVTAQLHHEGRRVNHKRVARIWRIPTERIKASAKHRVPLGDPALEVPYQARALNAGSGLVFPSPIRAGRLTKVLRTTGLAEKATVHWFRSTFRDWCADSGKSREGAEAALVHTGSGV